MAGRKMVYSNGGFDIPYEIVVNSRLSRINISMSMNGMRLSMPGRMNRDDIERLLDSKREWIRSSYLKFQSMRDKEQVRKWESGEKILYRGVEYAIEIYPYERISPRVQFQDGRFHISISKMLSGGERTDIVRDAVREWFIKSARDAFNCRLHFYSRLIGVSYNDVRIKEQKTRWGSCSKKKNLNFNWKLIMAPDKILDYVVVHELCHLKYMNHSKEYWDMVARYYPYYKEARKWLKENGASLNL